MSLSKPVAPSTEVADHEEASKDLVVRGDEDKRLQFVQLANTAIGVHLQKQNDIFNGFMRDMKRFAPEGFQAGRTLPPPFPFEQQHLVTNVIQAMVWGFSEKAVARDGLLAFARAHFRPQSRWGSVDRLYKEFPEKALCCLLPGPVEVSSKESEIHAWREQDFGRVVDRLWALEKVQKIACDMHLARLALKCCDNSETGRADTVTIALQHLQALVWLSFHLHQASKCAILTVAECRALAVACLPAADAGAVPRATEANEDHDTPQRDVDVCSLRVRSLPQPSLGERRGS
jgi:hypothetical protein